jgi:muramoyltetrapeptide carboxypeptidase LdcA involved in peptidoglycan recycling
MARTIKPTRLSPGDAIAIVAPAGPPQKKSLQLSVKRIERLGYRVYIHPQCFVRRGYLTHLFMATDFARAAGFIFGPFYNCRISKRTFPSLTLAQVLNDYFDGLKVPIISNVACGHGSENLTLPLGIRVAINANKRTFKFLESAVK